MPRDRGVIAVDAAVSTSVLRISARHDNPREVWEAGLYSGAAASVRARPGRLRNSHASHGRCGRPGLSQSSTIGSPSRWWAGVTGRVRCYLGQWPQVP